MSDDIPEPDCVPGAPHPRATPHLYGHAAAEHTVLEAFNSGRMHHAWLMTGPEGVGKATLAWRIARFLLAQPTDAGDGLFGAPPAPISLDLPPDHPIAHRVAALSEPRLFLLRRPWDERTKKLKTEITVDATRKLKGFFGMSAADGGRRVVIVDAADQLNPSAANALLKLLEEPPANATLLLIAHQPARLLPTIRSRCRTLRLHPLAPQDMTRALQQAGAETVEGPTAEGLAALADGSVGAAFRLIENDGLALYGDLVRLITRAPGISRSDAIDLAAGLRPDTLMPALHLIDLMLARLARSGITGPPQPEAVPGEAAAFARLNPDAGRARAWAALQQSLGDKGRHGAAVNLDPAALVLDMLLEIDKTARSPAPA